MRIGDSVSILDAKFGRVEAIYQGPNRWLIRLIGANLDDYTSFIGRGIYAIDALKNILNRA
jgi:hypothetical protein